jgi:VacB/RNase II family 3'-5' exoribonuclease
MWRCTPSSRNSACRWSSRKACCAPRKRSASGATNDEIARRRDVRDIPTITIDPDDAKDLDDALSVRKLENGHWEIGVHIADVSHYVTPGSVLDMEAASRATSVYLVDRVVPMLPEKLSNDLCSLHADTDKLSFSAIFELDDQARIKDEWFGRTVMRSRRRFAYAEAQAIIDGKGEGTYQDEVLAIAPPRTSAAKGAHRQRRLGDRWERGEIQAGCGRKAARCVREGDGVRQLVDRGVHAAGQ